MPEYLAPGVYVEEVSYRASTIEGVPTSTTGFAGLAPFGPVYYPGGPSTCEPLLVTSFPEFELAYGKLDQIFVGGEWRLPYLAHAARAFFLNGGQLLYISRVFKPISGDTALGVASASFAVPTPTPSTATWRARWPGSMGNVAITTTVTRSRDVGVHTGTAPFANTAKSGTIVEVVPAPGPLPATAAPLSHDTLRIVQVNPDGTQTFVKDDGSPAAPNVTDLLSIIQLNVSVSVDSERTDAYTRLGVEPNDPQFVQKVLDKDHPADQNAIVWLDYDFDRRHGREPGGDLPAARPGRHRVTARDDRPPGRRERRPAAALLRLPRPARRPGRRHDQGDRPVRAGRHRRHRHRGGARRGGARRPGRADRHRERAHLALRVPPVPVRDHRRPAGILGQRHPRLPGQLRLELRGHLPPVDRDHRPEPAARARGAAAEAAAPAVRFHGRHLRARRRRPRGLQGARQRDRAGPGPVRVQHRQGPGRGAEPRGDQRAALLPRPGVPRVGRPDAQLGPAVDLHQRAAPVHLPRALDRQGHPVGGLRAQQRDAVAARSPSR